MLATSRKLQSVEPTCPACGASTVGHVFATLATTVASDDRRAALADFFAAARRREWGKLAGFRDWLGDRDNLVAYVIRGDHPKALLIVIKDALDLYVPAEILVEEVLDAAEVASLLREVPLEWHRIE